MLKPVRKKNHKLSTLCMLLLASTVHSNPSLAQVEPVTSESRVLSALFKQGATPALQNLVQTAKQLQQDAEKLCLAANAQTLTSTRESWQQAYLAWRQAAPYMFGPSAKLERVIGQWPVEAVILDGILRSDELKGMRSGRDVRGYAASEFILFNYTSPEAVVANANCEHLLSITTEIAQETLNASEQWQQRYGQQFISAGDGKPFLLANDALSLAYAEPLNLLERMLMDSLGTPSGYFMEPVKPDMLDAWRSGLTKEVLLTTLTSLQQVLNLSEGSIVNLVATQDGLLMKKDPALAEQLNKKLDSAIAEVDRLDADIHRALHADPTLLRDLYDELMHYSSC